MFLLLFLVVLIEVQEYYTKDSELNLYIKNDTASFCQPKNCFLNCKSNELIQLKTYKYFYENTNTELESNTTALLYEACSGKQSCNVTKIDGFQSSPINQLDGNFRIKYVCPGKKAYFTVLYSDS